MAHEADPSWGLPLGGRGFGDSVRRDYFVPIWDKYHVDLLMVVMITITSERSLPRVRSTNRRWPQISRVARNISYVAARERTLTAPKPAISRRSAETPRPVAPSGSTR